MKTILNLGGGDSCHLGGGADSCHFGGEGDT